MMTDRTDWDLDRELRRVRERLRETLKNASLCLDCFVYDDDGLTIGDLRLLQVAIDQLLDHRRAEAERETETMATH